MRKDGKFGIVSIIGPGLIGGSIGLGLKKRGLARLVIGVGHREGSLRKALSMGAVDKTTKDLRQGVKDADIVILGTSVRLIPEMARRVIPFMKSSAILTDVGSTKAGIVKKVQSLNSRNIEFVGTHPLAGSERRGIEAASSDLFEGSTCILTPTSKNSRARGTIKALWEGLGARVRFLSPEEHDRILALTSHLPHAIAVCLVNSLGQKERTFTARGFRDLTRVASSDPALWVDIYLQNPERILRAINTFEKEIEVLKRAIEARNKAKLLSKLKGAKALRDSLVKKT